MAEFDKDFWEDHWSPSAGAAGHGLPVNPYLPAETAHLAAGTALDAGCGAGAEAIWLAGQGWQVTGADISAAALAAARVRAAGSDLATAIEWVEADLARWEPGRTWDLVVTNYAHADIGQLALYQRLASWVAPGGTLLIVAHLHAHDDDRGGDDRGGDEHGGHEHPDEATATLAGVTALFDPSEWRIEAAYENTRNVGSAGKPTQLRDAIVRAGRHPRVATPGTI